MGESAQPADQSEARLEDLLVAVQKSFSRLSNNTGQVPPEQARALIVGAVEFELSSTFDLIGAHSGGTPKPPDVLVHKSNGSITLSLKGTVEVDVRLRESPGEDDEQ